jgi:hypothetical protein
MVSLLDFKVDVKLEIQRLNQKMSRMEELLTELAKRMSPESGSSSPQGDSEPKQKSSTGPERPTELMTRPSTSEGTGLGTHHTEEKAVEDQDQGHGPPGPHPHQRQSDVPRKFGHQPHRNYQNAG